MDFLGFTTMKRPIVKKSIGIFYSFRGKAKSASIFPQFCICKRGINFYADMGVGPHYWTKPLAPSADYHGAWIWDWD